MIDFKPPQNLIQLIRRSAPSSTLSENYGRSGGYYGDEEEETSGYKAIMLYIQIGLAEYDELILEVVKLILVVHKGYRKKYPIVPAIFGKGTDFINYNRYFDLGYLTDRQSISTISDVLMNLTGTETSDVPAIIPDFFPKTDIRSLYHGKTLFENDDLMVIIGKKSEVIFAEHLKDKFTYAIKKRLLFVEIEENQINWIFKDYQPEFANETN